jgi:transposase-like protein
LDQYLFGIPLRKLAVLSNISLGSAFNKTFAAMKSLPHCADITRLCCSKFCGILIVDGKFVNVKGFEKKIPVIYGIDYLTHDIPTYKLCPSEGYLACLDFFTHIRLLKYPLQALVCDDNPNIRDACLKVYPNAVVQICQNHFKENIRKQLFVRTDPTYRPFMHDIEILFYGKRSLDDFNRVGKNLFLKYKNDSNCTKILLDIDFRKDLLLGYLKCPGTPKTTNLIESFNSHMQSRLKSIKGFKSFKTADLWLNAYFIKRRTQKFTDCRGKFKHLNGKTSLQQTAKENVDISMFFSGKSARF